MTKNDTKTDQVISATNVLISLNLYRKKLKSNTTSKISKHFMRKFLTIRAVLTSVRKGPLSSLSVTTFCSIARQRHNYDILLVTMVTIDKGMTLGKQTIGHKECKTLKSNSAV